MSLPVIISPDSNGACAGCTSVSPCTDWILVLGGFNASWFGLAPPAGAYNVTPAQVILIEAIAPPSVTLRIPFETVYTEVDFDFRGGFVSSLPEIALALRVFFPGGAYIDLAWPVNIEGFSWPIITMHVKLAFDYSDPGNVIVEATASGVDVQ